MRPPAPKSAWPPFGLSLRAYSFSFKVKAVISSRRRQPNDDPRPDHRRDRVDDVVVHPPPALNPLHWMGVVRVFDETFAHGTRRLILNRRAQHAVHARADDACGFDE